MRTYTGYEMRKTAEECKKKKKTSCHIYMAKGAERKFLSVEQMLYTAVDGGRPSQVFGNRLLHGLHGWTGEKTGAQHSSPDSPMLWD